VRLGAYEIEGELGRGGMGVVYRARNRAGAPVAVKVLTEVDPNAAARFQREAAILQLLGRHPHVCTCHEVGMDSGRPYLVLELHEGGTLKELIAARAPLARLVELLAQTARALHFAHEAGVVHRDVKPGNVLIDAQGRAVVSDFGVASVALDTQRLTLTGSIVGTPLYMSPEQAGGDGKVDRRADVYGLGVILHEVLTGEPIFRSKGISLLREVLETVPAPPPGPPALRDLCAAALHKDPARRPQTAEDFARGLEAWRGPQARAARRGTRALAVGLAALAGAGLAALWGRAAVDAERAQVALARDAEQVARAEVAALGSEAAALRAEATKVEQLDPASGRTRARDAHLAAARREADPLLAAAHVETACDLDLAPAPSLAEAPTLGTVLGRGQRAGAEADLLVVGAEALLADDRSPGRPARVARARRWAFLARLLDPERPLPTIVRALRAARDSREQGLELATGPVVERVSWPELDALLDLRTQGPFHAVKRETWPLLWKQVVERVERSPACWLPYESWLLCRPDFTPLWVEASKEAMGLGRGLEAVRLADVAWALEGSNEAGFWVARHLLLLGRTAEAKMLARRNLELGRREGPENLWHFALLVEALIVLGETSEARAALDAAVERFPRDAQNPTVVTLRKQLR